MPIKIIKIQEQIVELVNTNEPDWINKYRREGIDMWFHLLGGDNWVRIWSFELLEDAYQVWMKKRKSQNVAVSTEKA